MSKGVWSWGVVAAACACAFAAMAADSPPAAKSSGKECFYARNVSSWAPGPDRSIVNLKVNVRDYFQLKLLGSCPDIDWVQGIGLEHRGADWICSGLDATVIVHSTIGLQRCPAISVRKLTPEEVAALPPRQKP